MPKSLVDIALKACKKSGHKYEDPNFPATNSSIGFSTEGAKQVTEWKRVSDVTLFHSVTPHYLPAETSPYPSQVSERNGDGWLLGVLFAVISRQDLRERIQVGKAPNYGFHPEAGLFACQIFKNGTWHEVVVDDRIPYSGTDTLYGNCPDSVNELWPLLLEKSYAKLHRGYSVVEGGSIGDAMADFTGGIPEKIFFQDLFKTKGTKSSKPSKKILAGGTKVAESSLWRILTRRQAEGALTGCVCDVPVACGVDSGMGILQNHMYVIVDVKEVANNRLVRLCNPWGGVKWSGAWSPGAKEWTPELSQSLSQDTETFWMSVSDVLMQFTKLYVCLVGGAKNQVHLEGAWTTNTCGGSYESSQQTWIKNDQFYVMVEEPDTDVVISVQQPDTLFFHSQNLALDKCSPRTRSSKVEYSAIGFYVLSVADCEKKTFQFAPEQLVGKTFFAGNRFVSKCIEGLQPERRYVIVPCTADAGVELPFFLTVYSDKRHPIKVARVPETVQESVMRCWTQETSGGPIQEASFGRNPKLSLRVTKSVPFALSIVVDLNANPATRGRSSSFPRSVRLGVYLLRPSSLQDGLFDEGAVVEFIDDLELSDKKAVMARFEAEGIPEEAASYVVVVCTSEAGIIGDFTVTLHAPPNCLSLGIVDMDEASPASAGRVSNDASPARPSPMNVLRVVTVPTKKVTQSLVGLTQRRKSSDTMRSSDTHGASTFVVAGPNGDIHSSPVPGNFTLTHGSSYGQLTKPRQIRESRQCDAKCVIS